MSLIAAFAAAAMAAPAPAEAKAPVRCRPAPYLVADGVERSGPEKILVTGSHVPMRILDRRDRPCYLTKGGRRAGPDGEIA